LWQQCRFQHRHTGRPHYEVLERRWYADDFEVAQVGYDDCSGFVELDRFDERLERGRSQVCLLEEDHLQRVALPMREGIQLISGGRDVGVAGEETEPDVAENERPGVGVVHVAPTRARESSVCCSAIR